MHLSESKKDVQDTIERHGARPVEHLERVGFWDANAYVAHAIHLDPSEIEILSENDVGVAHCPGANMKLRSGFCPVSEFREAGVLVSLSTDGPASNNSLDMLEEMKLASLLSRCRPGKVDVESQIVFDMATHIGADILDVKTGRIESGFLADITILDGEVPSLVPRSDPISNIVYSANRETVRTVLVGGDILVSERELLPFDEEEVYAAARKSSQRLKEGAELA